MTEQITSRQNARVKEAAKLRSARQRQKQQRFVIDGVREIERARGAGIEFLETFVCPDICQSDLVAELADAVGKLSEVTPEVWEKLSFGDRSDGILVVAKTPERKLADLQPPEKPLVAVLEGLEKPGNVGAILRTADGAGVDAVIVCEPQTDLFNPNTIRASLGTVFAPNVCSASAAEVLKKLQEWELPLVATRPEAKQNYAEFDYSQGAALVFGSEADGLSDAWRNENVSEIRIPMQGIADSLNVSASAAVLFYEALRQRSA